MANEYSPSVVILPRQARLDQTFIGGMSLGTVIATVLSMGRSSPGRAAGATLRQGHGKGE